ncbi:hypothetical protein [Leuconostoc citreum]|uniref:hypothetical protein n=1 Tax=Leuconostoc citreum TaxID=33964 RepID=UPI002A80BE01|nr:hypothetical protein [Leuconostoc citreum]MDY5162767.1 hypothetical protein [Leuconostoc citreum]MDY5166475.1 hypothetical protein [Leuconostoc citreum]
MDEYPDVFTLDDEGLLTTDIELIKWFEEKDNQILKGLIKPENHIPLSEYEQTYHERRFKRYYD